MARISDEDPVNSLSSVTEILQHLQANASHSHKASVARMGVPPENAYGVSIAVIRKLARQIGTNHALVLSLWQTGNHEARLLAVLLADTKKTGDAQIHRWLEDVVSWDMCDHLCKTPISRRSDACRLVRELAPAEEEFIRRAAFSSMANICMHSDCLDDEVINDFLDIILQYANDDRNYIKNPFAGRFAKWARETGIAMSALCCWPLN